MGAALWVVVLTLVAVGMKLNGLLQVPWWMVFAPAWLPAVGVLAWALVLKLTSRGER